MPLLCYNITPVPVPLAASNPPVPTIPPTIGPPGSRGPAVNVTSELRGLTPPDYTALEIQRPGTFEYEWTDDPEYSTVPLIVGGPVPGAHAATHATAAGDPVTVDAGLAGALVGDPGHSHSLISNWVFHETFVAPEAPGTVLLTILENVPGPVAPTAQPGHPRTLQVSFPAGWEGGNVTVDGFNMSGGIISEIFLAAPGATVPGFSNFSTIVGATNSAPGGAGPDAATVETAGTLIVAGEFDAAVAAFTKLSVDAADEPFAGVDLIRHHFTPTSPPDGSRIYEVWYYQSFGLSTSVDPTGAVIDPGHTHTVS